MDFASVPERGEHKPGIDRPLGIAILAMGGQGGGVLADWIVGLAEAEGFVAQSTSVPGVAQRTGATIYYVEIIQARAGRTPILSLMPVPGDVDVVIAAEMMEAGRAIQRGLVSPDRTVFIASSHRAYSVVEKAAPGDGIADPTAVEAAARGLSRSFHAADMQSLAERAGSVISASLFGALAGSGALPFARAEFEGTIRAAGVGVDASLRAFAAGFDAVRRPNAGIEPVPTPAPIVADGLAPMPAAASAGTAAQLRRIGGGEYPADAHDMLRHGLARVVDYQDSAYGDLYLDRVARLAALAPSLASEAARQVAVALAYDDVIRVADLKTRAVRFARIDAEVLARPDQIVDTVEFMHPRVDEVCSTLPARIGARLEVSPVGRRVLGVLFNRPRRVRTTTVLGFGQLWLVAGMRRWRRSLLRHGREMAHVDAWLAQVERHAPRDAALALELLKCRRLVKGYSDTHARGQGKFDRVTAAAETLAGRADAADWVRRLRDAALADEDGIALSGALKTVASLKPAASLPA